MREQPKVKVTCDCCRGSIDEPTWPTLHIPMDRRLREEIAASIPPHPLQRMFQVDDPLAFITSHVQFDLCSICLLRLMPDYEDRVRDHVQRELAKRQTV
jgi:hypothetical protein